MIQINILDGERAGQKHLARQFPFRVGRTSNMDLRLEEPGVWDEHATLHFKTGEGFLITSAPEALVMVNGERVQQERLRNGDHLCCGSVNLQFWLAAVQQRSLRPREMLTWAALAALCLVEMWIIHRLAV